MLAYRAVEIDLVNHMVTFIKMKYDVLNNILFNRPRGFVEFRCTQHVQIIKSPLTINLKSIVVIGHKLN